MRSSRTVAAEQTRRQELQGVLPTISELLAHCRRLVAGYPSLIQMRSFPGQSRTRIPESTLLETPTAVPKSQQYTVEDIRRAAGFAPAVN